MYLPFTKYKLSAPVLYIIHTDTLQLSAFFLTYAISLLPGCASKMAIISEISLPQLENILEGHSVDINIECLHDSPNPTRSLSPGRRGVLVAIILFECFLAPVNILSGMMAQRVKDGA